MERKRISVSAGLALFFLVINIFLVTVIFTPPGHYNPSNVQGNINTEVFSTPRITIHPGMTLESRLVSRETEADWLVEKYQEYEIHKDREGKTVKEVPTSNFTYLKYWRYQ